MKFIKPISDVCQPYLQAGQSFVRQILSGGYLLLAICLPLTHVAEAAPSAEDRHESGRAIYNFRCYYCHGYSGDAKTLASTYLDPKPRSFKDSALSAVSRQQMVQAVTEGRPGTAMRPFSRMLSQVEIESVVDFVRREFMQRGRENTRYHIAENGWPNHERYHPAYPFALGEIPLDAPANTLSEGQLDGRALFLSSCITCHDRAHVISEGALWEPQAVSYPRLGFKPGDALKSPDSVSGASPFAKHDIPPLAENVSELARQGERIFQDNCAFCHGADGSGKNWIGTFLQPHARDLRDESVMQGMTPTRLRQVIEMGLVGTSMPAWRSVLTARQIDAVIAYVNEVIHPLAEE